MRIYPGTISRMAAVHDQAHKLPLTHYLDLAAFIVVAVMVVGTAVVIAFFKGLEHHTVMIRALPPAPPKPVLPPRPRLPDPLNAWTDPARDAPFSGTAFYPVPEPEPTPVTAVAAPEPVKVCEGPSCPNEVPARPWVCGTIDGDQDEEHEFCTRDCLQAWVEVQKATFQPKHAERTTIGATIRSWW